MGPRRWTVQDLLSSARMLPYLDATGDDWDAALALYEWNARISAAFFESLHYLEIGLRNAIDLTAINRLGPNWLDSTALTERSRKAVSTARGHAGGPEAAHGKVLAELPFGFWWSLLADEYNRRLWQPALRHAFDGPVRRRILHSELDELRRLRNRVAHHEPIHSRDLASDQARLVDVAGRIGPALRILILDTTRVPQVLADRTGS